ncbi:MAG: hypothetical protein ACRBN8_29565 [Nannocystales bacterium]
MSTTLYRKGTLHGARVRVALERVAQRDGVPEVKGVHGGSDVRSFEAQEFCGGLGRIAGLEFEEGRGRVAACGEENEEAC